MTDKMNLLDTVQNNQSILIVEDDKNVAVVIKHMLRSLNYTIVGITPTGEEALKILEKVKPDLILMDIMLEGELDGIETTEIINKSYDIPVIYLTAYSDDKSIQRAKLTQPYGFIVKPFEVNDLKGSVEIALYKKNMERKLKESELWFKATLSSIGDGVIATDEYDNVKFINHVFEELTSQSSQDCLGKKLSDIYETNLDLSTESIVCQSDDKSNADISTSKILITKDGRHIPIEEKICPIKNDFGTEIGKVISFRDLSKRRKAQLQAISAKDYYLNFFEEFPVLIWRANKDAQFNYFNPSWLEFSGRSIESQIYKGWMENIHPDDLHSFTHAFEVAFKNRTKFETEFRLRGKDAEYHWLICVANPFNDLNGNFNGFIGISYDITNKYTLEDELRKAKDLSEVSNKAKSLFIANMSHEIRTPLNGIMGLIDILMETKLDTEQLEYVDMIKESAHTLLGLLNNLLDFSKIEDNKEQLNESNLDLRYIINEIVYPYQAQAKRKGVFLKTNVSDSVPPILIGDEKKIQRVIANLLSNSVKFTEHGNISIIIAEDVVHSANIRENKMLVHFCISDTGIGIPKEKHKMIFDSFTQVDPSSTRRYSGSGLGLSIVKKLVEMMNGKVWLESEFGMGSKFHFVIELKKKSKKLESVSII